VANPQILPSDAPIFWVATQGDFPLFMRYSGPFNPQLRVESRPENCPLNLTGARWDRCFLGLSLVRSIGKVGLGGNSLKNHRLSLLILAVLVTSGCASPNSSSYELEQYEEPAKASVSTYLGVSYVSGSTSITRDGNCGGIYDSLKTRFKVSSKIVSGIQAFEGKIVILDLFDDELKSMGISSSKFLKNGKSVTVGTVGNECYRLNSYVSGDAAILNMGSGDSFKIGLVITKVLLSDGTSVSWPENEFTYPIERFETLRFN